MKPEDHKTEVIQFRLTAEQADLLNKAFKHYTDKDKEVITRAQFLRQVVMIACLRELGVVKIGRDNDNQDD